MDVIQRVTEIIEEYLPEDHFIVDISFNDHQGASRLAITLDGDNGVSIDTCALISRKVGYFAEEEELIDDKYNLEVSSPGADAPFTNIRQYHKNLGRDVKVVLNDGTEIIGAMDEVVDDNSIELCKLLKAADKGRPAKYDKEVTEISISDIKSIKVILTF